MTGPQSHVYRFAGHQLDTVSRELLAPDGDAIPLTAKAFDVLVYLVVNRERVVGKDELLSAVWPGRVVEENNLTQAVSALRRAFGTGAGDHRFIVTVTGRGYGFVAPLDGDAGDPETEPAATTDVKAASPRRWWQGAALAIALLVMVGGISALRSRTTHAIESTSEPPATLAVLPFREIGAASHDQLLELGVADTLISQLSRTTSLRVLSLGSTQIFSGKPTDPVRAGMTLGADYVVDGSTQRVGDAIRINARLVSLPDGRTVWAGTFDQTPDKIFTMQDTIAAGMSTVLAQKYAPPHYHSPCDGDDVEAYRAYLRGRYIVNRPNPRTLGSALAEFRRAIALDPRCARAWAGIAFTRREMMVVADHDPREQFPLADEAVAHALALDPGSAEAYAAKGFNQFWYHWDWPGAERSLRHAIALDPNLPEPHFALAHLLNNLRRNDEALVEARKAAALDPLSPIVNALVAGFMGEAGKDREARERLDRVMELDPDFWLGLMMRSGRRAGAGDMAGAERDARRAVEVTGGNARSLFTLALVELHSGKPEVARGILHRLEARARTGYVAEGTIASLYFALGDQQTALDWLERGYRNRDHSMAFLDVWFGGMAGDPRFDALLRRMKLPLPSATVAANEPEPQRH